MEYKNILENPLRKEFKIKKIRKITVLTISALFCIVIIVGIGGYYVYDFFQSKKVIVNYKTKEESDIYVRFVMESYDSILKNYWVKLKDDDIGKLFDLSLKKATQQNNSDTLFMYTREDVAKLVSTALLSATSTEAKKQLASDIVKIAAYNLEPIGRNGLFSKKEEVALRQNVSNINPDKDLYKDLGVEKGASVEVVEKAYKEKEKVLSYATTTEAKETLKKITYSKNVLSNQNTKKMYDEMSVEPTVFGNILQKTLYIKMIKISPTTLREFGFVIDKASSAEKLDSLVLDLRGNIGGSLEFLQYFLGIFIGQNQYAFDLLHQGNYEVNRTKIQKFEPLARYQDIVILTDAMTQSTAELTAAVFKHLHLATIVGETTRGWGTVENTYSLETKMDDTEKYSLFLVNSLTLRDDSTPIEGKGVIPDININDKNFKDLLKKKIHNESLYSLILEKVSQ